MQNREYKKTHPWLTFGPLNMVKADPELWMMLGEAVSKCFHIAGVPLMPDVANEFYKMYLTKGARATTAIEGNTLTEEEVRARIEGELKLPPSREYLGVEVDNIVEACNEISNEIENGKDSSLSFEEIMNFNKAVLKGLEIEDGEPGVIRHRGVGVGGYMGAPAVDCEFLLKEMVRMLNGPGFIAPKGKEMLYGVLKSIVAHVYFVWIHPFFDGNGRTARLIELKILLQSGVPKPAAHLMSNHYNMTREKYYKELDKTSHGDFELIPFVKYAVDGFIDGLKEQLNKIRVIQWDLCWINFVHNKFRNKNTPAETRRRHLMLDISRDSRNKVELSEIRSLTPRLAEHYSGKSKRTITRDINVLLEMGLMKKDGNSLVPERRQILAFLPVSGVGIKRLFEQ